MKKTAEHWKPKLSCVVSVPSSWLGSKLCSAERTTSHLFCSCSIDIIPVYDFGVIIGEFEVFCFISEELTTSYRRSTGKSSVLCVHFRKMKSQLCKKLLPTPRIELGTFRLQGERINHFAKQAAMKCLHLWG